MKDQRYYTGEEIHIGDRVIFCGCASTIMLVIDRSEFPPESDADSRAWWRAEYGSGFWLRQDAGADIILPEADEDLFFISRSKQPAPDATNVASSGAGIPEP